jgi:hypothetical protein
LTNLTYWGGHGRYQHIELALAEEVARLVPGMRVQFSDEEVASLDKKLHKRHQEHHKHYMMQFRWHKKHPHKEADYGRKRNAAL